MKKFGLVMVAAVLAFASRNPLTPGPIGYYAPEPVGDAHVVAITNYSFDPLVTQPELPADLKMGKYSGDGTGHYLVQLQSPVYLQMIHDINNTGANLLGCHSRCTFVAKMNDETRAKVAALPFVRWIGIYQPAFKLYQHTTAGAEHGSFLVYLFRTEHVATADRDLRAMGAMILTYSEIEEVKFLAVNCRRSLLTRIANLPYVYWIEEMFPSAPENNECQWVNQKGLPPTDTTRPVWRQRIFGGDAWGDPSGDILGHCDDGLDPAHYAFRDPLITVSDTGEWPASRKLLAYKHFPKAGGLLRTSHGTHTAGTVCGNDSAMGGTDARDGHSKNARLVHLSPIPSSSVNFILLYSYMTDSLRNPASRPVTCSNSWWTGTMGQYTAKSMEVDQFCWRHRNFVMIKSCGNQGQTSQYRITEPGNSKSVLSVGALGNGTLATNLATFSSRGPAPDGRVKPEACTPGDLVFSASYNTTNSYVSMSGTSMAAPSCNGSIGLLRSYLRKGFYPSGARRGADSLRYVSGALLKAMIAVSTDPNIGSYVIPSDYVGWGRFNLDSVLFFSTPTVERRKLLLYDDTIGLATGQFRDYQFTVSDGAVPLRAAVMWYDTAAAAGATRAIINDLNVRMIASNSDSFKGNRYSAGQSVRNTTLPYDSIDVLECFRVNAPNTGLWTLRVMARNVVTRPQPYAVVITGGLPATGVQEEAVEITGPMRLVFGDFKPNPARIGKNAVRFYAPHANRQYTLKVYDASGVLVRTLLESRLTVSGWQTVVWDSRDGRGKTVAPGVYFYRLDTEATSLTKKAILVK